MPILNNDPFGDFAQNFAAMFGTINQAQNAKADRQRQQQQDAENAALAQAQISSENAKTDVERQNNDLNQKKFQVESTQAGINPTTLQPLNYGFSPQQLQQGANNPDLGQRANFYDTLAVHALLAGATGPAQDFSKLGTETQTQAIKNLDEALKFKQFAEKQLQDAAQRQKWGADTQLQVGRLGMEAARLQAEVQRGQISASNAAQNLQLRLAEFNLRSQEFDLSKQRFKLEQGSKGLDKSNLEALTTIRQSQSFKNLAPALSGELTTEISKHGISSTIKALNAIIQGAPNSAGLSKDQAQQMLDALNGQ